MKSELKNENPFSWLKALVYSAGAVTFFHLAFTITAFSFLIVGFVFCVLQLVRLKTPRQIFYVGLAVGLLSYAPQLTFFWNVFHVAAIPLWLVLSLWLALFLVLTKLAGQHLGGCAGFLVPFLWLGLEYFRSELYYLRFSWLSLGYVFTTPSHGTIFGALGVYGIGFFIVSIAVLLTQPRRLLWLIGVAFFAATIIGEIVSSDIPVNATGSLRVAGVQLEFRQEDVLNALERAHDKFPQTDLYVLSEYTFAEPPTKRVKEWCRKHKTYLIAGGKDEISTSQFYNTAFVVGPEGEVVFTQVKSVPIQFFKDGLPATKQELWNSPWGKIGICICYDLSYRGVVDNLIEQGAQALVVPTMDVVDWGKHQHELHARIAPMRASEFHVPIFRLCSSGISQVVDRQGAVMASASFPGEGEMISGLLALERPGRLPVDHWLAPFGAGITGLFVLWLAVSRIFPKRSQTPQT